MPVRTKHIQIYQMKRFAPMPSDPKPMKPYNKLVPSTQSTLSHSTHPSSLKLIEDSERSFALTLDRNQFASLIRSEMASLQAETAEMRAEFKRVTQQLSEERNINSQLIQNLRADIEELSQKLATRPQQERLSSVSRSRRGATDSRKMAVIQSNMALMFQRLDQMTEGRVSINTQQKHIQQLTNLNHNVEGVEIQMRAITNQIQLEVAEIHDSLADLQDTVHQHIGTVGDKMRLFDLEKALNSFIEKVGILTTASEKSTSQIQRMKAELQSHEIFIEKYELKESKLKQYVEVNVAHIKQHSECQSNDLEEFLSTRLGRMIESYNNNFQEMDKSIAELRETVREVLHVNRLISDNLGHKLRNIIDSSTFSKTIANLNQKFSQTCMLNHEKIQELNSKEYQVEHQLNYMKDMIQNLKLDFKHNYSKLRLEEEVSLSSSKHSNLERSMETSGEKLRGFKKPNYIFPERDSFNFTEERKKRRSVGLNQELMELGFKYQNDS